MRKTTSTLFGHAIILAACAAGLTASYAAFAQDAKGPGAPNHPEHGAQHAAQPNAPGADATRNKDKHADQDIVEVATGAGMSNVTTLVAAIKAADLVDVLKGPGPFTVFAPTNEAFAKLPPGKLDELMKPENKAKLRDLLLNHVHQGEALKAADLKAGDVTTAGGTPIKVERMGNHWMAGNAKITKTDVVAKNGVIHQVDSVILPGTDKSHADHKH